MKLIGLKRRPWDSAIPVRGDIQVGSKPATRRQGKREARVAQRFDLRLPVDYETPSFQAKGLLWDISSSGARVEQASRPVSPGTKMNLELTFSQMHFPSCSQRTGSGRPRLASLFASSTLMTA